MTGRASTSRSRARATPPDPAALEAGARRRRSGARSRSTCASSQRRLHELAARPSRRRDRRRRAAVRTRFAPGADRATSTSATSRTRSTSGAWPAPRGGSVLLRIEDHDRQRCRPAYDAALLEDLAWLGFVPDDGPVRQSDDDAPYAAALDRLRDDGPRLRLRLLALDVRGLGRRARAAVARPGLPGRLPGARRGRTDPPGRARRRLRDAGWTRSSDRARARSPATATSSIRDRARQLDVRVRGRRRRPAPGRRPRRPRSRPARRDARSQIRLGRLLGRAAPPTFAHHRARPRAGRPQAVEGRRGDRRSATCGQRGAARTT